MLNRLNFGTVGPMTRAAGIELKGMFYRFLVQVRVSPVRVLVSDYRLRLSSGMVLDVVE